MVNAGVSVASVASVVMSWDEVNSSAHKSSAIMGAKVFMGLLEINKIY